jgi:glutaredoxin-like YruB-family protein
MAVTVYTTPSCSFCTQVKRYFKEQRVPFKEHNVANDERRAAEMFRKSGQMGVPVLDIHGTIIVGFDKSKIDHALRR